MLGIVRGIAIAIALAGLFASVQSQTTSSAPQSTVVSPAIPVPVCPPNDPNACHIDE